MGAYRPNFLPLTRWNCVGYVSVAVVGSIFATHPYVCSISVRFHATPRVDCSERVWLETHGQNRRSRRRRSRVGQQILAAERQPPSSIRCDGRGSASAFSTSSVAGYGQNRKTRARRNQLVLSPKRLPPSEKSRDAALRMVELSKPSPPVPADRFVACVGSRILTREASQILPNSARRDLRTPDASFSVEVDTDEKPRGAGPFCADVRVFGFVAEREVRTPVVQRIPVSMVHQLSLLRAAHQAVEVDHLLARESDDDVPTFVATSPSTATKAFGDFLIDPRPAAISQRDGHDEIGGAFGAAGGFGNAVD